MGAAIRITRVDLDAAGLRRAARGASDAAAARRMLALALVLEGKSRAEAAHAAGMDRQTLRDWVHRYNEEGLAGLSDRHGDFGPSAFFRPNRRQKWRNGSVPAPIWPIIASYVGAGPISSARSRPSSTSIWHSAR